MLKPLVIHYQHDDVNTFHANLQSPVAAAD